MCVTQNAIAAVPLTMAAAHLLLLLLLLLLAVLAATAASDSSTHEHVENPLFVLQEKSQQQKQQQQQQQQQQQTQWWWNSRRGSAASAAPQSITVCNLTASVLTLSRPDFYETMHAVTALQGIINRQSPVLYFLFTPSDSEWLAYLQTNWLAGVAIVQQDSIDQLLLQAIQAKTVRGAVVYDGVGLTATALLASTSAGAENLIPVCNRSSASNPTLYDR